jgi:hypothetical protein
LTPPFRAFSVQIKNHILSLIYRHDDETNVRLVEGIRTKIKKKKDWLQFTLLKGGGIEALCYSANRWNKRMPMQ